MMSYPVHSSGLPCILAVGSAPGAVLAKFTFYLLFDFTLRPMMTCMTLHKVDVPIMSQPVLWVIHTN